MPDLDWERIQESKEEHRVALAALPFDEKLQLLERLRDRAQAFQASASRMATNSAGGEATLHQSCVSNEQKSEANRATALMTIGILGIALIIALGALQGSGSETVAASGAPGSRT